jgi:hypothetical protein
VSLRVALDVRLDTPASTIFILELKQLIDALALNRVALLGFGSNEITETSMSLSTYEVTIFNLRVLKTLHVKNELQC